MKLAALAALSVFMLANVGITLGHPHALYSGRAVRRAGGHRFTLKNNCPNPVQPKVADTRCGFSPRCSDAVPFSGPQPGSLAPGASQDITINNNWVGRIFADNGNCGPAGDNCSMTEFNLDANSFFTPQTYDVSHIQGFTQGFAIAADGCAAVTCAVANCGCANGFQPGDLTGCGNDSPVRACGAGPVGFTVTFCP